MVKKVRASKLVTEVPGPRAKEYVVRDEKVFSSCYGRVYPFVMERGEGSVAWDLDGNQYIDFNAGLAVVTTGHCHPEVVRAITEQAGKFVHMAGTDFYYGVQTELAEKLISLVPGNHPKKLFFTNSGTESAEAALKLARYATGRQHFIAFLGAFHGRSMGSLSLTASKILQRRTYAPFMPGVVHVPYAYCYRCVYNLKYPQCSLACVDFIESDIFQKLVSPDEVAAIFVEPIQGEGGYVVPPPGFHPRLRELADRYGILLVADEIQTGMGRTGKWFAIEHWGVVPDIVTMAKGIASGLPMGATVARSELMTWPPGAHSNTFGGNPICCAAASATIRVIEKEHLMDNAAKMGERMLKWLEERMDGHPTIGEVRGKGLMIGIEMVKSKETKEPAPQLRDDIINKAFKKGLLLLGCGASTVRMMPALNIDADTVDEGLGIFEEALKETERAR